MTSYRFFKMAVAAAQYYFQFRICWRRDVTAFRKSKSISKPNFVNICQFVAEITTSVLEKQTSAILEFYFRFCFLPFHRNRRVIVHQPAEFPPNRTTHCGNMTSYQFFKTAAAAAQYYFRFRIRWCRCLQKVKIYQETSGVFRISEGGGRRDAEVVGCGGGVWGGAVPPPQKKKSFLRPQNNNFGGILTRFFDLL